MMSTNTLDICKAGILEWQKAFNRQDAAGCAAQYTEECVMEARPFGTFIGRNAIQAFWQNIIDQGFSDVNYSNTTWESLGDEGYLLLSEWTMNKAFGVVHREHWAVQADGKARLVSDYFEVLGEK